MDYVRNLVLLLPSAAAQYGVGSIKMRSSHGNIAAGFFPEILILLSRPDRFSTFITDFGTAKLSEKMNLS